MKILLLVSLDKMHKKKLLIFSDKELKFSYMQRCFIWVCCQEDERERSEESAEEDV